MAEKYVIGVDVGTGSVRAALITSKGLVIATAVCEIRTWSPYADFHQQSSQDVWNAVCTTVQSVSIKVEKNLIKGIGFDATCSLVVFDKNMQPVSVSPKGEEDQNIILWMDHRAHKEAEFINQISHPVLKYVGGKISLEMETPKLLWLKRNLNEECWKKASHFFDLPDYLTWRATGSYSRSLCSVVCKWTYEASPIESKGWNLDYFRQIGLEDLAENNWEKIGSFVQAPGEPCGKGLSKKAALELGLLDGTPVGTSIIDAHAGGLGLVGSKVEGIPIDLHTRLGLIAGTSTCHMCVHDKALFVEGVWGPYFSAMIPGMYLNEGGQSVSGKLIDFIIDNHSASVSARKKLKPDINLYEYLHQILLSLKKKNGLKSVDELTQNTHIWPDFHGNRSPLADPSLKGMVSGLSLSNNEEDLAVLYLATLQALAYGTRHIIETLMKAGYSEISSVLVCGGMSKNSLFLKTQSNALGIPVVCPDEQESVLLGAGMLAAYAGGIYPSVNDAIRNMAGTAQVTRPNIDSREFHDKKYAVYLKMVEHQKEYRKMMEDRVQGR